ncbi:hypothetical protein [Aliiroseovarius marinus]|uniref:hypothetical protein n=1 Tax=Aliiroseovarius marinus TaxID=2500159 RepID=UPI00105E652D|nr:hypothetical protein [Aliiroseovarius marinus]
MTKTYSTDEVSIDHANLLVLREQGKLQLGMNNEMAMKLVAAGHGPKKGGVNAATNFFTWLALGVFVVSIYYSFTDRWWWFILGFFVMRLIWNAVKSSTPDNLLDAAMYDSEFYEKLRTAGIWLYQMDEEVAREYTVAS